MPENSYSNYDNNKLAQLKTPPHSNEAEEAVIGALLINADSWEKIESTISTNDFYKREFRIVFDAISSLANKYQPFDYVTVINELRLTDDFEKIGGEQFILNIVERITSASNVKIYANLVREKSVLRQMIEASGQITEMGYFPGKKEVKEVIDSAEQKIFRIAEQYQSNDRDGFLKINQITAQTLKQIEILSEQEGEITGLATGWKDFDEKTLGLQKGDLFILAARPSMGKTALCLNIATNVALFEKKNVAIFSLEMPAEQLTMRLISALGQINQTNIRKGTLEKQEWKRLRGAVQQLANAPIFINDNLGLTPTEMRSNCRRLVRENGPLGLIIVDYLQLMDLPDSNESRANVVSEISRSLKMLAKEFDCTVMALSQLNRSLENRTDKRPIMSDLRESGAIEQDADIITFIYRDAVYAAADDPRKQDKTAEIIIGKQRNGPIGSIKLTFLGEYTQFVDYAHTEEDYGSF